MPRSGATCDVGAVGDHDRQVGAARVGRARLPGRHPGAADGVGEAADRDHLELVVDVVADQQVRRVGVQRVADPLRGERQVVVDGEPEQRVVTQAERVGLAAIRSGDRPGRRVLEQHPLGFSGTISSAAEPSPPTAAVRREDRHRRSRPRPAACRRPARPPSAGSGLRRAAADRRPGRRSGGRGGPRPAPAASRTAGSRRSSSAATVPSARELDDGDGGALDRHRRAAAVPPTPSAPGRPVAVADQPDPLRRRGVLDAPRRGDGRGDEQAAAALGRRRPARAARWGAPGRDAGPRPRPGGCASPAAGRRPRWYRYGPPRW